MSFKILFEIVTIESLTKCVIGYIDKGNSIILSMDSNVWLQGDKQFKSYSKSLILYL